MRFTAGLVPQKRFIAVATVARCRSSCRGAVHQMQGFHPAAILLAGTYGCPVHHHILSTHGSRMDDRLTRQDPSHLPIPPPSFSPDTVHMHLMQQLQCNLPFTTNITRLDQGAVENLVGLQLCKALIRWRTLKLPFVVMLGYSKQWHVEMWNSLAPTL